MGFMCDDFQFVDECKKQDFFDFEIVDLCLDQISCFWDELDIKSIFFVVWWYFMLLFDFLFFDFIVIVCVCDGVKKLIFELLYFVDMVSVVIFSESCGVNFVFNFISDCW